MQQEQIPPTKRNDIVQGSYGFGFSANSTLYPLKSNYIGWIWSMGTERERERERKRERKGERYQGMDLSFRATAPV